MSIRVPGHVLARRPNYRWWVFASISVGTFTSVADGSSVIVALPSIAAHFDASLASIQWVAVGYLLTISALLMPIGRLSDMVGRKSVYVTGFGLFVAGAGLAGFAENFQTLILFRIVQGVGAGMTQGTGMAAIVSAFPDDERGTAIGAILGVVGTGAIAGTALGGFITGEIGWRWVFYGNAMLGMVATVASGLVLIGEASSRGQPIQAKTGTAARQGYDWLGAGLSAAMLVSFLLMVTNGPRSGWTAPITVSSVGVFVVCLCGFVWWELRSTNPMIDLRLFRHRLFSLGVIASFIAFVGASSMRFLMPFYLQSARGMIPQEVGLMIVPASVAMMVMGPVGGRLSDRFGWRPFTVGGLAVLGASLWMLARVDADTSMLYVIVGIMLVSVGNGTFNAPNNSSILSTVERSREAPSTARE